MPVDFTSGMWLAHLIDKSGEGKLPPFLIFQQASCGVIAYFPTIQRKKVWESGFSVLGYDNIDESKLELIEAVLRIGKMMRKHEAHIPVDVFRMIAEAVAIASRDVVNSELKNAT